MDKFIQEFEALSTDAEKVQMNTLKRILEDNASAQYLQNLGLNGKTDPESFKACVPLVTHKDSEPYINRIIDGDASPILTTKPITAMSLSSGTTQRKPKYIPWNDEVFETTVQIHQAFFAYLKQEFLVVESQIHRFESMSKLLKPNPELADIIHKKCLGLNNWYGLLPELFPNAKYIYGIMTGSMEPYLGKLRHYAGELPLVTSIYGASEGFIAANINPKLPLELATYVLFPQNGYFEFIPLTQVKNEGTELCVDPHPVGLTEVKVGEEYEIVLTNSAGLYRYRLGDVVNIMGFSNSTLKLKFIRRSSVLLSVNIDKTTEKNLLHVDLSNEPGNYVIFWEISGEASEELLSKCCNCLDKSFTDPSYSFSRKANTIGALELRVVGKGTFQKILDHYLGLGTSISQYKTARYLGLTQNIVLQILNENVVKKHLSTAFN
ncbi:indole-3-acetic acid-amido synthetase [Medicago truncatula]|uniref:Indole-3-acetic acid-amido synthetase n=1 Tax=Medicago truncatula TaxID=3880 RepID=G7LEI4_MEDTR|nr:indole-3-acetic acid-amido synthetase [Medicago truncatula]